MFCDNYDAKEPPHGFGPWAYCLSRPWKATEPAVRIELTTYSLQNSCSTAELRRLLRVTLPFFRAFENAFEPINRYLD